MTTAKELHQERDQLIADHEALIRLCAATPPDGTSLIPEIIEIYKRHDQFNKRWNAHWAELDRAAADLPPSMRID